MTENKNTITSTKVVVDGVEKTQWTKTCPHCHKKYTTTSRRQKYCCTDCAKKHAKQLKESRARYDKVKEFERLRVRAHALAVSEIKLLCEIGVRTWKCECCGATEGLEIHHKDNFNWMNNTPSNLMLLCKKCHAKEHSRVEKELNEKGILVEEYYEPSMQPFHKILNK